MADRNGAAIHVEFMAIETQFTLDSDHLRAKGFVDFKAINLIVRNSRAIEKFTDGWSGSDAHDFRSYSDGRDGDDTGERFHAS